MNNRLDFISKFKDENLAILEMSGCRREFIELDRKLQIEAKIAVDYNNPAMGRSVANARTHLEEALQHSIKALCLKNEDILS